MKHVAILGGGIAGLAAAAELRRRRPALGLTLFEARPSVGGRVLTATDDATGERIELGAEFVHGRPAGLLEALRAAGLTVIEEDDGASRNAQSPFAMMPRLLAPLLGTGIRDQAIGPYFAALKELRAPQRRMLGGFVQGFYLAPPERASARAIARMEVGASAMGGASGKQVREGYGAFAAWLARSLRPGELHLSAVVEEVRWGKRVRIRARALDGTKLVPVEADAAVVALPFPALRGGGAGAVRFIPALPEKHRAARALRMGHATKVLLRFRRPVELGSFLFAPRGPVRVFWTAATADTRWLIGWAGGRNAVELNLRPDGWVLEAAVTALAKASGRSRVAIGREIDAVRVVRWSREPFIEGAYAWVPLGADGAMATLATPVGAKLAFAGEHTEPSHAGTVHGAYESGVRAATELLDMDGA